MSSLPTEITSETYTYLCKNFAKEDEFLQKLNEEAKALGIPDIRISADQAAFLRYMLKAVKAKNVLELGSLAGYSAISMARALPANGKLVAVELIEMHAKFIGRKAGEAGLRDIIHVENRTASDYLDSLCDEDIFDFVFIDADKERYIEYFDKSARHLKRGGIIAADNVLAFGYLTSDEIPEEEIEDVEAIRKFNDHIAGRKDFETSLVTIGDGLSLSLKL